MKHHGLIILSGEARGRVGGRVEVDVERDEDGGGEGGECNEMMKVEAVEVENIECGEGGGSGGDDGHVEESGGT